MDKLKPILEQRFWILSGLAIILTFVGWSMGKSSLAAAIQSRRDKLKAAFDSVAGSGANPNEKWTQQVSRSGMSFRRRNSSSPTSSSIFASKR